VLAAGQARPVGAPPAEGAATLEDTALDHRVLDQLREDLGGPAGLRDVILTFLRQTPPVLAALREAAVRADAGGIREAAHRVNGTSAMLGARALAEQCAELEVLGRAGTISDAQARVAAIETSYRAVESALAVAIERGA
jgi:HPt (histidine-containing phosphotransfer) domain-containing protein